MRRVLITLLGVVICFVGPSAGRADAHGERTQAPWVRTLTATFFDVSYTGETFGSNDDITLRIGETLRLSGRLQLSTEWPAELGDPKVGYLGVNMPGPVLAIRDKQVNGRFTPGSITVQRGDSFAFDLELAGRRPGRWHIHPRIDIEGEGPLLGPGRWVTVRDEGGPLRSPVQLANGETIDLERFGLGHVAGWHLFWLAAGVLFAGFWLRRGLFRQFLAVRRGHPGAGATAADRRVALFVGALALGVIVAGPVVVRPGRTVPQQVALDRLPSFDPPSLGDARIESLDIGSSTLTMRAEIRNTGTAPLRIEQLVIGPLSFRGAELGGQGDAQLRVTPDAAILPGATQRVALAVPREALRREQLVHTDQTVSRLGGLLIVKNDQGERSWMSVASDLIQTG